MRYSLISAAMAFGLASAQTFTDCDPTKKTCPSDNALGKTITVDFTKGESDQFTLAEGTTLNYDGDNGAAFSISKETDAPTITSAWYIFFGKVEVVTQAAPGSGVVSSFVMESDDLDEIDWEWLGTDTTQVESNYFGKGNTTSYDRAIYHPVSSPQTGFHTYTIDWTKEAITWSIDGASVRTLNYADAVGGKNFPQTPMRVKMGNWGVGKDAPDGTAQWAGGRLSFPGTYTMYVKSVTIQDYTTTGSTYTYSDMTGSYESIQVSGSSGGSGVTNSDTTSASSSSTSTPSSGSSGTTSAPATTSTSVSHIGNAPVSDFTTKVQGNATAPATTITTPTTLATTTTGSGSGSGSTTGSATRSSGSATSSPNAASSRFGNMNAAVAVLGLGMGYLFL